MLIIYKLDFSFQICLICSIHKDTASITELDIAGTQAPTYIGEQ